MSFIITARNTAGETYFYPNNGRWTKVSANAAVYDDKAKVDKVCADLSYKWKGLRVKVEPQPETPTVQLSALSEGLRKEVKKHLKEGKVKLSQLPKDIKKRILKETGEWDDSDESMTAWKSQLQADILDIGEATNGRMKLKSVHGFDVYQGPYAMVSIDGKSYKVWTIEGDLWIEGYKKNDNTSGSGNAAGFQGRPDEIADMLNNDHMMSHGFGLNETEGTRSLWGILGIKDMRELPQSPALPEIMQMLRDNDITGPFKYGRFGADGLIYVMGNGGKIGIGVQDGKLAVLSVGMLWDL